MKKKVPKDKFDLSESDSDSDGENYTSPCALNLDLGHADLELERDIDKKSYFGLIALKVRLLRFIIEIADLRQIILV